MQSLSDVIAIEAKLVHLQVLKHVFCFRVVLLTVYIKIGSTISLSLFAQEPRYVQSL